MHCAGTDELSDLMHHFPRQTPCGTEGPHPPVLGHHERQGLPVHPQSLLELHLPQHHAWESGDGGSYEGLAFGSEGCYHLGDLVGAADAIRPKQHSGVPALGAVAYGTLEAALLFTPRAAPDQECAPLGEDRCEGIANAFDVGEHRRASA